MDFMVALMPSHEKHCQDSERKYGKRFEDLHSWMDEPRDIRGRKHRMFRHDSEVTPQEAKKLFGEFADHACLDHIRLDQVSSDEIKGRTMDTDFCEFWKGDENSKYCRECAAPGEPCYELWKMVCQLAANGFVFTNNIRAKAFGNKYRIESPQDKICYLQMLQGKRSRFQLPIEDFLYVTITGQGDINQTPSGTRQYPFVHLLLEIIAADANGAYLIDKVRHDPKDLSGDFPGIDETLLGPADEWSGDATRLRINRKPENVLPRQGQHLSYQNHASTCPRCGSPLAWHTARKTGERYKGCTNYPNCKYNERSY